MSLAGDYDLQVEGRIPELEKLNALLPALHLPSLHRMSISTHLSSGRMPGDLPVIGETRLQVGSADLGNRLPGLTLSTVDVSLPKAGGTATTSGAGRYTDRTFTFAGTFELPERLDGRFTTLIDLKARMTVKGTQASASADASLALNGKLTIDAGSFDGLDATVGLRLPVLAATWSALPRDLPALTDVSLGGRVSIPADRGSLRLHGATLSAHELDVAGDLNIGLASPFALDGRLRASRLDMDALLVASRADSAAPGVRTGDAGGPVIPNTPLPWSVLRGKAMHLTASIAALTFARQVWRDVDLALQLAGGRLQISPLRLVLPGGPMEMWLSADASKHDVPVSLTLHAPGIPLALLARYAALPGDAGGDLHIEMQLKAHGSSAHDLAASLDGPVAATMTRGSLSNAALIELASASLRALGIEVPAQGETAIRCFGILGSFNAGVGRFRSIALDTTLPAAGRRRAGRSRSGDAGAEAASAGAPFRLVRFCAGVGGRTIACPFWPTGRLRPRRARTAHRRMVRRRPAADLLGCRAGAATYACTLGSYAQRRVGAATSWPKAKGGINERTATRGDCYGRGRRHRPRAGAGLARKGDQGRCSRPRRPKFGRARPNGAAASARRQSDDDRSRLRP